MTTFSVATASEATVAFERGLVWEVLTDTSAVARLTPTVRSITATGDLWHWQLGSIPVLGRGIDLAFTERMELTPPSAIVFRHAPQGEERAGADGRYDLRDAEDGSSTALSIDLEVTVDLPFPRLARPAVEASMHAVLAAMGAGFARAIDKELRTRAARRP